MSGRDPSIEAAVRDVRKRKRRRLIAAGIGLLLTPVFLFAAYAWFWGYQSIPDELPEGVGYRDIADAMMLELDPELQALWEANQNDPFRPDMTLEEFENTEITPTPPAVEEVADMFVREMNRIGYGTIIEHDVDAYATLYVVPGFWFYEMPEDHRHTASKSIAALWRGMVREAFGDWRGDTGPDDEATWAPGVLYLDCLGEVSRDMDGMYRSLREPTLC